MKVGIAFSFRVADTPYNCIKTLVGRGFDNGQLCIWDMNDYNDSVVEELKRACKDFNFTITAVWCGWSGYKEWSYPEMYNTLGLVPADTRRQRTDDLLKGAEFAYKLGVQDVITHIGYLPDNPYHPDNIGVVKALKEICEVLKARNQYFLFETGEELPLSLAHLICKVGTGNLGINFDPGNLILNGRCFYPPSALKFFAPLIRGMHAKDALMPVFGEFNKIEVLPGEGDSDFPTLVKILKEIGYEGSISIENEKFDDPNYEENIQKTKKYLEDLIKGE